MSKNLKSTHIYANAQIYSGSCYLKAFYISSAASQTTDCYAHDGTSTSDPMVFGIDPSAQGIFTIMLPEPGILCEKGLFVNKGNNAAVTVVYQPV